jgi:hypothetical protein
MPKSLSFVLSSEVLARRARVAKMFPSEASLLRLASTLTAARSASAEPGIRRKTRKSRVSRRGVQESEETDCYRLLPKRSCLIPNAARPARAVAQRLSIFYRAF